VTIAALSLRQPVPTDLLGNILAGVATVPHSDREREEIARRGDEIYERDVCPHLGPDDEGKFVLIDVESGDQDSTVMSRSSSICKKCWALWVTSGAS
jgi:hypothetical protein